MGRSLGILISFVILMLIIAKLFIIENRTATLSYREEYREQGRNEIRQEAIRLGVAEVVQGEVRWSKK